ncbi:MAG: PAS domain-containing sensor histidine kinase [Chloroflexi bacterium]|nr:PAS domain-containing sensor histidine kinase [Chloroflexota bacterium]
MPARLIRLYAFGAMVTVVALGVALALSPVDPDDSAAALLFLAAVGLTAWLGGLWPAFIPTVAGGLAIDYFFEVPRYSFAITSGRTVVDIVSFVLVAVLVGLLNHQLHRTNQRLREQRDRAEAAVQARDDLIATVSHALRTPLTTIKASVFSLRDPDLILSPDRREPVLARLASEADRLIRFVTDALALSRLETMPATRSEWNDVGEIVWVAVDRCLGLLGDRPVSCDVPETLPLARFDASLLDQTVTALLENVAVHTPPGSGVWIEGGIVDGRDLRVAISDAGPGIPPADRERIFGRYERIDARGPGVGLGLAVARAAARAQGGHVWIEDSSHGGACVVVLLPDAVGERGAS